MNVDSRSYSSHRTLSTRLALGLMVATLLGCSTTTGPAMDSVCGEVLCEIPGKSDGFEIGDVVLDQEVDWAYSLDSDAEHRDGSGRILVRFFHRELPLSSNGLLDSNGESALQPAVVTLEFPSLRDPSEMQVLEFLALLQTWDDGESYSVEGVDGQGAWLSTSLPDVVERFNAVYDPVTQTGTPAARVDASLAFSSIRFVRDQGDLAVDRITMTYAERFGDTRRFDRITTGRATPEAGANAQQAADEMFFRDGPVVREWIGSLSQTYSLQEGTIRALAVDNLRDAVALASERSLEGRTTLAVFEHEGLFALGELRFTRSGNRVPAAVAAFYENAHFERVNADGPAVIVDHAAPYFVLGLCRLSDEPVEMALGSLR